MKRRLLVCCAAASAMVGCADKDRSRPAAYHPARLMPGAEAIPPAPLKIVEVPVPLPLPGQLLPAPRRKATSDRKSPAARIAAANREALREPASGNYLNAVQVYPWSEGALYRLYTAPEQVSDIALQPGEGLVAVAAGDTVR